MKSKFVVLAVCLLLAGSTAFAETYYLPHVGLGSYTSGSNSYGFTTTFVFFNNTATNANVTLSLTKDDGTPMSATIPELGTKSTFEFVLPQAATLIYETDISGAVRSGAATVTADSPIGVSGIFTLYNNDTGSFITEVGVGNASLVKNFVIPAQATADGAITTGLALFNPGSSDSSLTMSLKNEDGTSAGSVSSYPLAKGEHKAVYLNQLFPSITSFTGTLTIGSSADISAMTLRQNAPSAALTYTSIPVVEASSGKTTFNLAQFADSAEYKTTFMLFNLDSSAADVTIALKNNDGSGFPVEIGSTTADTFTYTIPAGQSRFLQTKGTGTGAGAAQITSTAKIGAAGLFTQYNGDGSFNTEAGVQDSPTYTAFTLPVDSKAPDADTGIALYNPTDTPIDLFPIFLDQDGLSTTAGKITLAAYGHYADFFGTIFPNMGAIQGSFTLSGLSSGVAAMALRMNLSPFSMTSLPVIEGATPGFVYSTAAVGGTASGAIISNVAVTGDKTYNKQIYWGYRLPVVVTGYPTSGSGINQVQAISTSGRTYKPYTVAASSSLYVAPGVYKIRTAGWMGTSTSVSGTWLSYTSPDLVTVTATTSTANITIPAMTTYTVAGTIAGVDKISSATGSQMVFISTDDSPTQYTVYCSQTNGSFSQAMPAGTYVAGIQALGFGSTTGTENMGFLNIGTFTVSGDMTVDNLAIPDSPALSGTASFVGGAPAQGAVTITAKDSTAPVIDSTAGNLYAPYITSSTWTSNTASGAFAGPYDMQLIANRDYNMSLAYSLYASTSTTVASGVVTYTPLLNDVTLDGNGVFDFANIPAPSALVTLSGKLTNSLGNVSGATVTAVATSLTGAPNSVYRATGTTATDGTWSMKVPRGNYRLYLSSYGTPFVVP